MTLAETQLRQLDIPPFADLYELDYSKLVGNPLGTPESTFYFTPSLDANSPEQAQERRLAGITYLAIPCMMRGLDRRGQGGQVRPTIEIANAGFLITQLIDSVVGGDLRGSLLTRKTIFTRHLDDGEDPDPLRIWAPVQRWIVFRKSRDTSDSLEFTLATPVDVAVRIPTLTVESSICPWSYIAGGLGGTLSRCTWNPVARSLFFDADGEPTNQAGDICPRTIAGCKARFGGVNEPLRFGGFPAAGRAIR